MTDSPQFVRGCRRRGWRYRLQIADRAFVEIPSSEGSSWRLDLLDVGTGGVCFGLEQGHPDLQSGTRIDGAVLHVGGLRIAGRLLIAHVTEEFGAGTVCGAEFDPDTEADVRALKELIDNLETTARQTV
jgi:hypothetical protein